MPKGNDTIFFIYRSSVPTHKKVTYGRLVATIRLLKSEVHRVRLTVGGYHLDYAGNASLACAAITIVKMLLNSTISTTNGHFGCIDIKDFYHVTSLDEFEYMRLLINIIPKEIIVQHHLRDIADDGHVYIEIQKGMLGLKQAGHIANNRLVQHLSFHEYAPIKHTASLWKHKTNSATFALVVDDFDSSSSAPSTSNTSA